MNKSKFESLPTKVIPVKVNGVNYNASPMSGKFEDLRNVKYGEGFIQGTFGHQFALVHGAYLNPKNTDAQNIVLTTKNNRICGNTVLYGERELIFAVDFPEFRNDRIVWLSEQDLTSRLSSRQERDIFFSKDGFVRAMPRANVEAGVYDNFQIASSTYPILLTGDRISPQKSAEILTILQRPALLLVPSTGILTVPGLDARVRFDLGGNERHGMISLGDNCSFGLSK